VAVSEKDIRISGSTRMLERAIGKAEPVIVSMMPIF
jgi:hypothetical protein